MFNSKLKIKNLKLFIFLFCFAFSTPASAELTSTNYKIEAYQFTGGSGDGLDSTSYELEGSYLSMFGGGSLTSTNYGLDNAVSSPQALGVAMISSIDPGNYAKFFSDSVVDYTVTATGNATINYELKKGATSKDGPQTNNQLDGWSLSVSDLGRHDDVTINVSNTEGSSVSNQSMYVVRRPVK